MKNVTQKYKQEGEIIPLTCHPWATISGQKNLEGVESSMGGVSIYYKKNYGEAYWNGRSLEKYGKEVYQEYSSKEKIDSLFKTYFQNANEMDIFYSGVDFENISTPQDVVNVFEKLVKLYEPFWKGSLFIDSFDVGIDRELISEITEKYGFTKEEEQILLMPDEVTNNDKFRGDLLQFVLSNKDKEIHDLLNNEFLESLITEYDYMLSNYSDYKPLTHKILKEKILEIRKDLDYSEQELEQMKEYKDNKQQQIKSVLDKYVLKDNPLYFFQKLTYWREHRKEINLKGIVTIHKLLNKIEELTNISIKFLKYMLTDEIEKVLSGQLSGETLKKRFEQGVFIVYQGNSYQLYVDDNVELLRKEHEDALGNQNKDTNILCGQTASNGYVKGSVRIIMSESKFNTFKDGEILVTSMTRPEFLPIMKRSTGIITNEGGITCHAAIVSRELGIPCIIGTKVATQVLQNGDIVEINTEKGIVKVL